MDVVYTGANGCGGDLMTLRITLDGQVRGDLVLKKHLESRGRWLSLSESQVRRVYERHACIPDTVQFQTVRIYLCLIREGETRVVRTRNWGESKRLKRYEADVVINVQNPTDRLKLPSLEHVVREVSGAAVLALAQIALQFRCPSASAIELARASGWALEGLGSLGFPTR
jgi:hypothetical protein